MNQPTKEIWWHMFKILRFRQPNASRHPTSLAPLSRWPNPSWTHWHLIIKHNFSMVCTSFGTLISFFNDFEAFLKKIGASFGNSDKEHTSTSKLWTFHQGWRLAYVYVFEFRSLACDISWDEVTFMNQFQFGFCGDLNDLLLTMSNPMTLNQAIMQAMHCDNQLFERQQKKHWEPSPTLKPFMPPMFQPKHMVSTSNDNPMQINKTQFKPFIEHENNVDV